MANHHPVQVPKCLNPECRAAPPLVARGLCGPCYAQARAAVLRGEVTWGDLEEWGVARRPRQLAKFRTSADWLKKPRARADSAAKPL